VADAGPLSRFEAGAPLGPCDVEDLAWLLGTPWTWPEASDKQARLRDLGLTAPEARPGDVLVATWSPQRTALWWYRAGVVRGPGDVPFVGDGAHTEALAWGVAQKVADFLPGPDMTLEAPRGWLRNVFASGPGGQVGVTGASAGLALVLSGVSRLTQRALPMDFVALAGCDPQGRTAVVGGLTAKIEAIQAGAPRIRRLLIHPAQGEEAQAALRPEARRGSRARPGRRRVTPTRPPAWWRRWAALASPPRRRRPGGACPAPSPCPCGASVRAARCWAWRRPRRGWRWWSPPGSPPSSGGRPGRAPGSTASGARARPGWSSGLVWSPAWPRGWRVEAVSARRVGRPDRAPLSPGSRGGAGAPAGGGGGGCAPRGAGATRLATDRRRRRQGALRRRPVPLGGAGAGAPERSGPPRAPVSWAAVGGRSGRHGHRWGRGSSRDCR
jgi:hypothetical protein